MADQKTTWERLKEDRRVRFPMAPPIRPDEEVGELAAAMMFVCNELDAANNRIAELERNLAEMAKGGRNG